jgi:hypothetical protein
LTTLLFVLSLTDAESNSLKSKEMQEVGRVSSAIIRFFSCSPLSFSLYIAYSLLLCLFLVVLLLFHTWYFIHFHAQKLSSTRGTACLSWPITEEVWLYLAVKLNQVKALKKKGLLGKASKGAADLLAKLIDHRLAEYQQHESLKSEVADVLGDVEEEEEEVEGTKPHILYRHRTRGHPRNVM